MQFEQLTVNFNGHTIKPRESKQACSIELMRNQCDSYNLPLKLRRASVQYDAGIDSIVPGLPHQLSDGETWPMMSRRRGLESHWHCSWETDSRFTFMTRQPERAAHTTTALGVWIARNRAAAPSARNPFRPRSALVARVCAQARLPAACV